MGLENISEIDRERVKERVDSYITNQGYRIERMITCERFGIPSVRDIDLGAQAVYYLIVGMNANGTLGKLFAPLGSIYEEGRRLFAKASALTPTYRELSEKDEAEMQKYGLCQESISREARELSDRLPNTGIIRRFLLRRKIRNLEHLAKLLEEIAHKKVLPPQISEEGGIGALNRLYFWLQIGEEDEDSKRATDELSHPSDLLSEEQIRLLQIREGLYKIKNHTAIVCLDQLQKYGLNLDKGVQSELRKIPKNILADVSWGKLRNGSPDSFGEGLF